MLKWHAFVFTHTKLWTTGDSNVGNLSIPELCMMCDVWLIYLGNNKYGELKCKPEILSPLPWLLPVKQKSLSLQYNLDHTAVSPTKDLVVGILDANQSICTLLTLPNSPEMTRIEESKKAITLKPHVETDGETSESPTLEPQPNSSMDIPSSLSMDTPSFDAELTACEPSKDEQCNESRSSNATTNITDKTTATEGELEPKPVETASITTETVHSEKVDNTTTTVVVTGTLKTNDLETDSDSKDKEILANPSLPSPIAIPLTSPPGPQLPHKDPTTTPLEPTNTQINHQVPIKTHSCTVRLEILTESDIIKHVHVHREKDPPVETVEMPVDTHYTRSSTKSKPNRITCHPRTATKAVNYSSQGTEDDGHLSPTPKHQWLSRPRKEPSSSRIKSDSFKKKQPSVTPLRRSPRTALSPVMSNPKNTAKASPAKSAAKATTSSSSTKDAQKGTFKTKSYGLKRSKRACKFGCRMCSVVCASTKELIQHHQQKHNILYCDVCLKAFNNPSSLARHQYSHKELKFKMCWLWTTFCIWEQLTNTQDQSQNHPFPLLCVPELYKEI